jgi:hypothetical protein
LKTLEWKDRQVAIPSLIYETPEIVPGQYSDLIRQPLRFPQCLGLRYQLRIIEAILERAIIVPAVAQ